MDKMVDWWEAHTWPTVYDPVEVPQWTLSDDDRIGGDPRRFGSDSDSDASLVTDSDIEMGTD
jgi:hypothetical protein